MSKLSFRARALDASKPMPIYLAEELPDLPDYSAINRAVPQMPSGMEKEEESEHHLQRAISGTGLIIPTPEVSQVCDIEFYEKCYPPDYKMPKQHIHMQPLWEEQEAPEYDIDSEDERWLKQQRHPELTELKFEQMMDKLERSSGQTVVTLNEAKLLLERQDDLVIAVYDYWLNKRLTTQHPLILSVRTESRPGQSTNNPYLAFRRRTEKMQTRKNRKNDESSYEKMLKLRRDLARALTLLELVARRERAKRELVKLTALLAERRYVAGDFANQLLPDPPPRPAYTVPLNAFRPEKYSVPHYAPRPQAAPVDAPRQREKRPYKRRKHRHAPAGASQGHRDSGVYTSSEEESPRTETALPDDGPFAFRRKPGCYYEMPTSTLYGDPVDSECSSKDGLFQHELDPRHRYTLTSIRTPYPQCVGFARRRVGRGGRVLLDRTSTPLDDLWRTLPFHHTKEQPDIENKRHRTPTEITTDYHTSGKYPWRHAFRRHLSRKPDLWLATPELKPDFHLKPDIFKLEALDDILPDVVQNSEKFKSDISVRTMDVGRKRAYSDCSDSSYDSDQSLLPVEQEFERFIDDVNKKWLHFRPQTPPPPPPPPPPARVTEGAPLPAPATLAVQLGDFTTAEFSLASLYPELPESLDVTDDMMPEFNDVGSSSMADPFLFHGRSAGAGTYSGRTQSKMDSFGSSYVRVTAGDREPIYCAHREPTPIPTPTKPAPTKKVVESRPAPAAPAPAVKEVNEPQSNTQQVNSHQVSQVRAGQRKEDTIEEIQLPHGVQLKTVQTLNSPLKKHIITSGARVRSDPAPTSAAPAPTSAAPAPTSAAPAPTSAAPAPTSAAPAPTSAAPAPTCATPAPAHLTQLTDTLKVRLQNHLLSGPGGVILQNGPFPHVVSLPVQSRESVTGITSLAGVSVAGAPPRRAPAPLVQLAPAGHKPHAAPHSAPLVVAHTHLQTSKLKVLHAHPLTHTQRSQLMAAQSRGMSQLPAVVSLATLSDPKSTTLFKASQGSVAQLFEIKSGQLGKGPHLVNVVRQPAPGKAAAIARLDLNDKKRQLVFDGTLKGQLSTARPARVAVSLDARQLVRAPIPAVRPHKHQIHLKSRATLQGLQVGAPMAGATGAIPGTVVANLLHKNAHLAKGGQKIAISSTSGAALSANVQAIAFNAQLRARTPRLLPPRAPPPEIVDASSTAVPAPSQPSHSQDDTEDGETNGNVRRRTGDVLPMEVT